MNSPVKFSILQQIGAIFYKNTMHHFSHKKKLLGQLVMPTIISLLYIIRKNSSNDTMNQQNIIIVKVLDVLLMIYIGFINTSAIRQTVTLFITERTEGFRQYQMILGLSYARHFLANFLFMCAYMAFFMLPFFITLCVYDFRLFYIFSFSVFIVCSTMMTISLTALFKDHKIALEIIGIIFSLSSFLVFLYEKDNQNQAIVNLIAIIMPNSAFTISLYLNSSDSSIANLFIIPFLLILYISIQFFEIFKTHLAAFCQNIRQRLPFRSENQNQNLIEDFQLNEVVNAQLSAQNTAQKQIVIKTINITKKFQIKGGSFNALNNINISIKKKKIFGILGRNGAGKTTLVDILTKVIEPTSGNFIIKTQRNSIGICYQHEILYQHLSIDQHLQFYGKIKLIHPGQLKEKIEEIIRDLSLQSQRSKKVNQLSGGNKRKLSIAIAILNKPQILIFDEPTSGLDPLSRIYVWQVIEKLRSISQSAIILTTHHLDEAQKLADWICVFEKGNIIVQDSPQKIKQKHGKGYHLSLYKDNYENFKSKLTDIQYCRSAIQKNCLQFVQLEHFDNQINFVIHPMNKDMQGDIFEENFIQLVELFQKQNFQIAFYSNNLEESFIAILKGAENNSGDSLENSLISIRGYIELLNPSIYFYVNQIFGIILKNFYYNKSIFMQSIILYNINIIIILLSSFFNKIILNSIDGKNINTNKTSPIIIIEGYIIMATAFIGCSVYEKQKKIRAVLNTRGLSPVVYWLGSFIFDYTIFLINLLILYFLRPQFIDELGITQIQLFGIAVILFSYCCSFIFEKLKTANSWFTFLNIILGMAITLIIFFGQKTFLSYFTFIKYLYPYYNITAKAYYQMTKEMHQIINIKQPESVILITIFIYLSLLVLIEIEAYEKIKIFLSEQDDRTTNSVIKLDNVSKNYKTIEALKNVSYEINQQRLALLGHNGAGKSTTFGLLSSQKHQTSGKLFLQGKIKKKDQIGLKSGAICYQDDALWEGIHVFQILKIFSFIYPINDPDKEWKWLFENLEYDQGNMNKRFDNLSGGNKRKLCLMVALYGEPNIRLLDECSTGLDPSSRLAMVETIKYSQRGCTVFTTHSMSEAESLCSKAVIMSKGKVLQFDYISKLVQKYYNCCWMDITYKSQNEQQIMHQLQKVGLKINTNESDKQKIRIEINKINKKISQTLRFIQKLKRKGIILTYTNIQPRLENVYIQITKSDEQRAP